MRRGAGPCRRPPLATRAPRSGDTTEGRWELCTAGYHSLIETARLNVHDQCVYLTDAVTSEVMRWLKNRFGPHPMLIVPLNAQPSTPETRAHSSCVDREVAARRVSASAPDHR